MFHETMILGIARRIFGTHFRRSLSPLLKVRARGTLLRTQAQELSHR